MALSASLEKKRYLLILDNVWEHIDFDQVGIIFHNDKGNNVLISTRNARVIGAMGGKLVLLKDKVPVQKGKLKRKAFTNDLHALDRNIEHIARPIAKECEGFPLAVNAAGAMMVSRMNEEDWHCGLTLMGNTNQDFQRKIDTQIRYIYNVFV